MKKKKKTPFNREFTVAGQLPPEKNCPPVRGGVWVKVSVSFRVGGQPDNCPRRKEPPVWVSFGQFSSRAIVLEPELINNLKECFI